MRVKLHNLISFSDEAFEARLLRYVKKYFWLSRKENRFSHVAVDGPMDFGMFDAFDNGVKDYAEYVRNSNIREIEYKQGVQVNHLRASVRTALLRVPIKSERIAIRSNTRVI